MPLLITHQGRLISHPHYPPIPCDNSVLYLEGFAGLVRADFLGQHPLPVFRMNRPNPVLLVDHLRLWRISENGVVLWAHISNGFGIIGLERLLYVGDGRDLLHERPVTSLSLRGEDFKFLVGFL